MGIAQSADFAADSPHVAVGRIPRRRVALLVVAALSSTLVLPQSAAATASCQATSSNYFDGGITTTPNYYVSGSITDRTVSLCTGSAPQGSAASAWIMIAGGGAHEYAQIGFANLLGETSGTTKRFTEYNDGSDVAPGWVRSYWPGFSAGTVHTYVVSFSFASGRISMIVDGSTKANTPWGADTSWSSGWTGQVMGETVNLGDDVPGTSSTIATAFGSLLVKTCRGCSQTTPAWLWRMSDVSYYKYSWTNSANFKVWTQR